MLDLLYWDVYEVTTDSSPINGVMLRGRIRKLCLEKGRNVLAENTVDLDKSVRFALPSGEDPKEVIDYLKSLFSDVKISLVREKVPNPVLSKLKVNIEDRYTL